MGKSGMATQRQYRERAKEARKKAEVASDEATRLAWLEVAKGYERLADGRAQMTFRHPDQPGKTPWSRSLLTKVPTQTRRLLLRALNL